VQRNKGKQKGAQRLAWRTIYLQLAEEAKSLGIPGHALPTVAEDADVDALQAAHEQLANIIASFNSAAI